MISYRRDLWKVLPDTGDMAEIGVAEGLFSRGMLLWPIDRQPKLYMVDRWRCVPQQRGDASQPQTWHDGNFAQAQAVANDFPERAILLRGDSKEMAARVPDRSLALVYVDADHSFEGVSDDIRHWFGKLVSVGVMAFHDYENEGYGVKRAVAEFARKHQRSIHLLPENKSEDAGAYIIATLC